MHTQSTTTGKLTNPTLVLKVEEDDEGYHVVVAGRFAPMTPRVDKPRNGHPEDWQLRAVYSQVSCYGDAQRDGQHEEIPIRWECTRTHEPPPEWLLPLIEALVNHYDEQYDLWLEAERQMGDPNP